MLPSPRSPEHGRRYGLSDYRLGASAGTIKVNIKCIYSCSLGDYRIAGSCSLNDYRLAACTSRRLSPSPSRSSPAGFAARVQTAAWSGPRCWPACRHSRGPADHGSRCRPSGSTVLGSAQRRTAPPRLGPPRYEPAGRLQLAGVTVRPRLECVGPAVIRVSAMPPRSRQHDHHLCPSIPP